MYGMTRRAFGALVESVVIWSAAARAQGSRTLPRIGYLSDETEGPHPFNSRNSVLGGLSKLGYQDGRNITIDFRYAAGKVERLPALAAELVALPVDVIFSVGTVASKAAIGATTTIPIVFSRVGDPVRYGLVASLSHPGRNATGASLLTSDLAEKRLELLKQMVPGIRSVAVLHEQNFVPGDIELKQLVAAGTQLNVNIRPIAIAPPRPTALEAAFPEIVKASPGALFVGSSGWFEDVYQHTLDVTAKTRLPALYVRAEYVAAGGLMSYGINYPDMYSSAVDYIVKILKGEKASDLPVWQPTKVELAINLRTAQTLDLAVPPSLLAFAERVIE
jgi:putative tryptophan/tyrosine transport system substrate-binding protein